MVQHKRVIYLPLSLHGHIIHLRLEMITPWPKVEKAAQHAPLSPTVQFARSADRLSVVQGNLLDIV